MKFVGASGKAIEGRVFKFEVSRREKLWLLATLRHYPLLDSNYHRLSTTGAGSAAEQELLESAMTEQRRAHRKKLDAFLSDKAQFKSSSPGVYQFKVTGEQAEWLLQVLNEVRLGSWLRLGRPDPEQTEKLQVTPKNVAYLTAMQLSGYFQMSILTAFRG